MSDDPKHTTDQFGVLLEPRFVPDIPARLNAAGRMAAVTALLPKLRDRPNVWAAVAETQHASGVGNIQHALRRGKFGPMEHWEASARTMSGKHVLYMRYVGPKR